MSLIILDPSSDPVAWRPEVADVAALLVARTGRAIDDDTVIGDTFTEHTNPTAEQVERFIDFAVVDVRSRVAVPIIDEQLEQAMLCATLYAAALAERGSVPQGAADEDRSTAPQLLADYTRRLDDLKEACLRKDLRFA